MAARMTRITSESLFDRDTPVRSVKVARGMTLRLRMKLRHDHGLEDEIREETDRMRRSGAWELIRKAGGDAFRDWEEFVRHPDGLDAGSSKWLALVIGEARAAGALGRPGGDRRSDKAKVETNQGSVSTLKGKRDSSYLARRLMRDAPEVFERLEAGEFPSVRRAAIAAGIVREPTALERARRAVGKLSDAERVELLSSYDPKTGRPR